MVVSFSSRCQQGSRFGENIGLMEQLSVAANELKKFPV
jgi:hypothetical protein